MTLPAFRYHPDPIASGSIIPSDVECRACGLKRGYICTAPVYAEEDLEDALCPWCIADGSANRKFAATFVDSEAFPDGIPDDAVQEISERTPGFNSWQGGHWPVCCRDAAAFVTPAGIAEIRRDYYEVEGQLMTLIVQENTSREEPRRAC
ncbi:MAG: CbrC family protein [Bryobacteraceae bacterium]